MAPTPSNEPTPVVVDSLAAYETVRPELEALSASELSAVNLDILIGVTTVLGALPKLRTLRSQLAELQGFDLARFDRLELYARALGHTHTLHLRASPSPEIAELADHAVELRETLLMDATALARRGLVDGNALEGLKGAVGYRNLAFDLGALSNLLRQAWGDVRGKSAVQESELNLARTLADRLLTAVGLRQFEAPLQSDAALTRQRAFTLFIRAYDQVRRAVTYLRWNEEDANDIAPSLYERRNTKSKANAVPEVPPTPTPEAAPVNGAPPASATPGLPGDDPFETR